VGEAKECVGEAKECVGEAKQCVGEAKQCVGEAKKRDSFENVCACFEKDLDFVASDLTFDKLA
jgi:hypothetical protein